MKKEKYVIAAWIGGSSALLGILLCCLAQNLAWPASYGYSGSRRDTGWATQEQAYQEIGLLIAFFGFSALLILFAHWLEED